MPFFSFYPVCPKEPLGSPYGNPGSRTPVVCYGVTTITPTADGFRRGQCQVRSALADESGVALTLLAHVSPTEPNVVTGRKPFNATLIALKSDTIFAVASYRIDSDQMNYTRPSGLTGSVNVSEVDWRKTSQLNADRDASLRYQTH